ncbi:MAG TPA: glycosyltransferase family 39 protein [Solirubrobacteraceae bacterium]|nr:glycosyltransferase family 39 protein [Solirubrobacteraceae bacterium]
MPHLGRAVWILLAAALVIRLLYVVATPGYVLVHDAKDYDRHARSIAIGHGYADSVRPSRPTAFRPPGFPVLLAGVYKVAGVERAQEARRVLPARIVQAVLGTLIVGLVGLLAAQLWDRRVSLVATALAAVYLPLILVGGSVMSEPLFAALLLSALAAALAHRESGHRFRFALLAGFLAGLTILTRANAGVLLAPLAYAVWNATPRLSWRALAPPAALVAMAILTVSPWTIRNALELHEFVPVSTQLGSALAGTYNDQARTDRENPASWRSRHHGLKEYEPLYARARRTNEAVLEKQLRKRAMEYISDHPGYLATVAFWTSARMLDLAGMDWSRHTASTISVGPDWATAGVACFWIFAVLALAGAFTAQARRAPWFFWAVPVLLYLGVVLLVVETPRYRTGIDPFIVMLAALVLTRRAPRGDGPRPADDAQAARPMAM